MFLKDIRDNILTMSFTTLSSSMKTSLSEFSFSSWTLRSSFFIIVIIIIIIIIIIFVFDSLPLKKYISLLR